MPKAEREKVGHRRKGQKTAPQMRGAHKSGPVLGEADNQVIIDELRRFTPLCSIAAKLNVARHTLEKYVHSTPELELELIDRDEAMIDLTERSMFDASIGNVARDKDGRPIPINVNAGALLLERKGRKRGWGQHVEVSAAEVPTFTFCRRTSAVKMEDQK